MVELAHLAKAYRKAKADAFFGDGYQHREFSLYEENLRSNLEALMERISGDDLEWVQEKKFLGPLQFVAAGSRRGKDDEDSTQPDLEAKTNEPWGMAIHSNPESALQAKDDHWTVQFRPVSQVSVDFHVLSALWVGTVGAVLDDHCLSRDAYANRPRRDSKQEYNWSSIGSFEPYYGGYRRWQDGAFEAVESGLDRQEDLVVLSADIRAYFHSLDPHFLNDSNFLDRVANIEMTDEQRKIHRSFVQAICAWSTHHAIQLGRPKGSHCGLPVNLPASGLVANIALAEFDRLVSEEIKPIYYGRYVDDLLLVIKRGSLNRAYDVWQWIARRLNFASEKTQTLDLGSDDIKVNADYLETSSLCFNSGKGRVYFLDPRSGPELIGALRSTIQSRSSEWRALPTIDRDSGTQLLDALQSDGVEAEAFGKVDSLSSRRARLALKLRDFEEYGRTVALDSWRKPREEFFRLVGEHILSLPAYFDFEKYLPRIVNLAIETREWSALRAIGEGVERVYKQLSEGRVSVELKGFGAVHNGPEVLTFWRQEQLRRFDLQLLISGGWGQGLLGASSGNPLLGDVGVDQDSSRQREFRYLYERDLASQPFKFSILPPEFRPTNASGVTIFEAPEVAAPVAEGLEVNLETLAAALNVRFASKQREAITACHPGLVFPTRPCHPGEFFGATRYLDWHHDLVREAEEGGGPREMLQAEAVLSDCMVALRGFSLGGWERQVAQARDEIPFGPSLRVPASHLETMDRPVSVAVTMYETPYKAVERSLLRDPDMSASRFNRVNTLMNDVLRCGHEIDYVVLPELSLPSSWFFRIADKLKARGISLIAGVEYLPQGERGVSNQVWMSLVHDGFGFPSFLLHRQDKQHPAPGEEVNLAIFDRELMSEVDAKEPSAVRHGDFSFAAVVCSELTDIQNRAALRGRVDALFVPEWNKDVHSFSSLVESAALDLHAYVVQVNNRMFGDSRVRVPAREKWERDEVRIQGGRRDYFVVGDLDVVSLRSFQRKRRDPSGKFKPLPQGFDMSVDRWRQDRL